MLEAGLMLLFRYLTYSNNEITETKIPIITQVKVTVKSEFVLGGEVGPLLGKESVGVGVTMGDGVGVGAGVGAGVGFGVGVGVLVGD